MSSMVILEIRFSLFLYYDHTDHTRENVPLLVLGKGVKPVNLGVRATFADVAATICDLLDVEYETPGTSFAEAIL